MARCAFCDQNRTLNKEHVIARKFKNDAPPPGPGQLPRLLAVDQLRGNQWESDDFDIQVRAPCPDCNAGWMNDLDDLARPIIRPMLRGEQVDLAPDDQHVIARWATKIGLVADFTHRATRVMRPRDFHTFYETREPTALTGVWLAAYAESRHPVLRLFARSVSIRPQGARLDLPKAHLVTFRIGHAVFQVVIPWIPMPFRRGADNERFVVQIWPETSDDIRWPPERILRDDEELTEFSEAFISDY